MTSAQQIAEVNDQPVVTTSLEFRRVVWFSQKVQVVIACLLIAVVIGVCFGSSLGIGFLLDDFLHLEYSMRALHNQWVPLLGNLFGNWGDSDLMRSYRPIASLSIFLDAIFARTDAWRYHLTNLILYFGCCCFVSLITVELTGRTGNRMSGIAALWAGLLFAVYPLHPESVAWIIGRVDLLCGLFYLASVFLFLRFQLIRERIQLQWSLACFLLALLSKEMAVTLPVVITVAAFLVRPAGDGTPAKKILTWVGSYWVVLLVYALVRNVLLGTTIGGYGESSISDLLQSWRVFLDRESLLKVFVGANEEYLSVKFLAKLLLPAYVGVAVCLFAKVVLMRGRQANFLLILNTVLFLLAWIVVALLPTFQIWHVFPNLVGSRLFFLSSAPLCILLSLAAIPALEIVGSKVARATTIAATLILLYVFFFWAFLTRENMTAWIDAGTYTKSLKKELHAIAARFKDVDPVLVLNLPRDNRGAGMITRQKYMSILMTPSLTPDEHTRFLSIEPNVSGDPSLMWPQRFIQLHSELGDGQIVRWSTVNHQLMPWSHSCSATSGGSDEIAIDKCSIDQFVDEPPSTVLESQSWNRVINDTPCLESVGDKLRVYPGDHGSGVTLWLRAISDSSAVDPFKINMMSLNVDAKPEDASLKGVTVVWESSDSDEQHGEAAFTKMQAIGDNSYVAWLGRSRRWTLAPSVTKVGVHFNAGVQCYDLSGVKLFNASSLAPSVSFTLFDGSSSDKEIRNLPLSIPLEYREKFEGKGNVISFDATRVPRAKSAVILISATNQTFDTNDANNVVTPKLPPLTTKIECSGLVGTERLPKILYNEPGYHEIQVVALDNKGDRVGVPSEPIPFILKK